MLTARTVRRSSATGMSADAQVQGGALTSRCPDRRRRRQRILCCHHSGQTRYADDTTTMDVAITVTNVEEDGTVTLKPTLPIVGMPITATVDRPGYRG